jgi:putative transposase
MKKKRLAEEQIIAILKEGEAGLSTADLCRKHGMSSVSFYAWRLRCGGMEVSDAKRLKDLEDESRRLKTMVADLSLDVQMLKAVNSKNGARLHSAGLWFVSLRHAKAQIAAWRDDYNNNVRSHSSLADLSPAKCAQSLTTNRPGTVQEALS